MHSEPSNPELAGSNRTRLTLTKAVKNQYIYKLKAYSGYFCTLILMQVIAELLMLLIGGQSGAGGSFFVIRTLSPSNVVLFSELWALIVALLLTPGLSRSAAFLLPCNRISDSLSDLGFILTGCLFGCVTAGMIDIAFRVAVYTLNSGMIVERGFYPSLSGTATLIVSTFFYLLFFSSIGYFSGMLIKFSKAFYFIIPAMFFLAIYLETKSAKSQTLFRICWSSIFHESSLAVFAARITMLSALMLAICAIVSYRMEVRE